MYVSSANRSKEHQASVVGRRLSSAASKHSDRRTKRLKTRQAIKHRVLQEQS